MTSRLPKVESLDDIIDGLDVIPSNCDSFYSVVLWSQNNITSYENKAVSFDVYRQFKVSDMMPSSILLNEEGKRYFEVPISRDGDIISHIDIECGSTCTGKLKISQSTKQYDYNKRIVHCASIYSPVSLFIILGDEHDMDNTIFLSWKVTCFLDNSIRKRVMYANLLCDGIRYLDGIIINH